MVLRRALAIVVILLGTLVSQPAAGAEQSTRGTDPVGQWPLTPVPPVAPGVAPPHPPSGSTTTGLIR